MKLGMTLLITVAAAAIFVGGAIRPAYSGTETPVNPMFTASVVEVGDRNGFRREVRRDVRQAVRRVERRYDNNHHHFFRALPRGCSIVIRHGQRYSFCGGVYYQEVFDGGLTAYIIVNL